MTIQLEFDFHCLAYDAVNDLMAFALSVTANHVDYFSFYRELQTQARDLTGYAYLNGCIDTKTHEELYDIMIKSSDLFWS